MNTACPAFGTPVAVAGLKACEASTTLTCQRWGLFSSKLLIVRQAVKVPATPQVRPTMADAAASSTTNTTPSRTRQGTFGVKTMDVSDAMEFFRAREGTWTSNRVTHHLAFRRSESGSSEIVMTCLSKDDERIISLLDDNQIPRDAAQGGCYVTWKATMAWDQEGENHEGSTVFALVPDDGDIRQGRIIRDRGYAEIVPIAGRYYLDNENALCLTTPYEGGSVEERFAFNGPNMLYRVSTVRRFGGMSNATFATESKIKGPNGEYVVPQSAEKPSLRREEEELILSGKLFLFEGDRRNGGGFGQKPLSSGYGRGGQGRFLSGSASRLAAANAARAASAGRPSPGSAFGSGFSTSRPRNASGSQSSSMPAGVSDSSNTSAAEKAGIDLSKVPPSMREDFARSLGLEPPESEDRGNGA